MSLQNRMNKVAQKIDSITKKMREMEAPTVKTQAFTELEAKLQKAQAELQKLRDTQAQWESAGITSGGAWDALCVKIGDAEDKVFEISAEMERLKSSGEAFTNSVDTEEYQKLKDELGNANAEMNLLNVKTEELATKMKKTGKSPKGLLNGLKRIKSAIGGAISKMKNLHTSTKKTNGGFSNLIRTMKQMVLSMAVFQAMSKGVEFLKSGLQNLAVYSKEYNKHMSALVSSTGMLKNSLAVAFAPIISAAIPYLVKLIDWVSAAANAVSRFFAILGGKSTYTKAIKQNKNYAASLDKVGNSAEEAKGSLAAFDDLDVLQKNDTPSGGGGGSTGGADGSGFKEEAVGEISDWAKSFKDAIDAGDWYSVGALVAQKLNEALAAIDWGFVQDKAAGFATALALALNGFVDGLDWNLLGSSIGNGINTALIFAFTFLTTFDFLKFGQSIATGLNSAISTTDFSLIGGTLAAVLMAVINTGFGFVTTFDWSGFGSAIATGISTFFSSVNWETCGLTVSGLILGILDTINTAIAETDWQSIGNDVATFLGSIDWSGIFGALGEGVLDVLSGINDFLVGVIGNETAVGIIEGLAVAFGILAASIAIYNGVMAVYNAVTGIAAVLTGGLTAPILLVIIAIVAFIAILVVLVTHWEEIKEKATEIFGAIKEFISNAIEKIKDTISDSIKTTKAVVDAALTAIKTGITTSLNAIKTGISTALNTIKTIWNNIWTSLKTTVTNIFNGIWKTIKGVINSILGGIEGMANGVIKGINKVIGAMNGLKFDVPDWVPVMGGKTFGFDIKELSEVKIPRLANGGITTGSTLANIGEAGREAVLPLENNTGWMDDLANKLASKLPTYGTPSTIVMEVDGKEFAHLSLPYLDSESKRIGVSLVSG